MPVLESKKPPRATKRGEAVEIPPSLKSKLQEMGFEDELSDNQFLYVETDLDLAGKWGTRHLVVTPQHIIVLSETKKDSGSKADDVSEFTLDLQLELDSIVHAKTMEMVGASGIEVELKQDSQEESKKSHANGNKSTFMPPPTVEVVRASASLSKTLEHTVFQIEQLREHGVLKEEDPEEEEDWAREVCPRCGRAFPKGSHTCAFCSNKWTAMARLLSYLKPYSWLVVVNLLTSLIAIGLSFAPSFAIAYLTDKVFPNPAQIRNGFVPSAENFQALWIAVGIIILAQLFSMVANIIHGRGLATIGSNVLHDIRTQLYGHIQHLSIAYFDKREVGSIMTRVQNDVQMLQRFLLDGVESILISLMTVAIVLGIMFFTSWQLALATLIPVPFVIFGTRFYWNGLMRLWRRVWRQNSVLGARLADTLSGVRVVHAFAQEDREAGRFIGKSGQLRDATIGVEHRAANFYPVLGFVIGIGSPITWLVGGYQVLNNILTLGGLVLFTTLLGRLYQPIQQLTRMINMLTRAMASAERIFEVLDTKSEVQNADNAIAVPHVHGKVEFRDVTFGYDKHHPVLHNVNFEVEQGQMVGLVGHTGAGKSTLINLLMRFYDVTEGAILVDGHDLREIRHEDLRRQIGVVLQESYLFHGSIYDNIAYAKPEARPHEVIQAAKAAHAHDFIIDFPDGYDALVGERGMRLSGGQRQRISIARAILHDPRILILDEATASVDTRTEQQIQLALENLIRGRTTIAIAHRLSTLRNADKLVVIEYGRVAEEGSHDELMEKKGIFYELVEAQQALNTIVG